MNRAFAYLRVSGRGQIEGDGFKRQELAIRSYAEAHGFKVSKVFREEGISGTSELNGRAALLELLAQQANGTQVVLIEKLDRLARDLMVQENLIADIQRRGFRLISVAEPDLLENDPTRKLMRQIIGAISEYEKQMIVLKLRGARERAKAQHGKCEGRKLYGARAGESEIIARMKELRGSGASFRRIAAVLNEGGTNPRTTGKRWHGSAVSKILKRTQPGCCGTTD
jgi:DNA invertase Pin-like site-specific DNA recombinase